MSELDARADMCTRLEWKYIVTTDVVADLLRAASGAFDVLDIAGRRDFGYDTRYFDDECHSSYHAHRQGRRRRFKVRTRRYVESGLYFAEIKLRWTRGLTVKQRAPCGAECHRALSAGALACVRSAHRQLYGAELEGLLLPAIDVRYRRVTLAARDEPSRITIDCDLAFVADGVTWRSTRDTVIVEVKSAVRSKHCRALFSTLEQRPVKRMSKYCLGMAATGRVQKTNRFRRLLRRLGMEADLTGVDTARP